MKFITDSEKFNYSGNKDPGSFEMWYFEALDNDDEYFFTARIFTGNPFAPAGKKSDSNKPSELSCGIRFYLYYQNRLIYDAVFDYKQEDLKINYSDNVVRMQLDKNSFYFDRQKNKYHLNINYSSQEIENKFKAEFEFAPLSDKLSFRVNDDPDNNSETFWLPVSPINKVMAKIKFYKNYKRVKSIFEGKGYIEKSFGKAPSVLMHKSSYLGKFLSDNYSFVFFVSEMKDGKKFMKILAYKNNLLMLEKEEFDYTVKKTLFSSKVKSLEIKSSDLKINLKNDINIESSEFGEKYISIIDVTYNEVNILKNVYGFFENGAR
ncbi:MAG: hypothetical protein IPM38_01545 [Ignavibacteria bacterium]|nr:hypothetical protein [Ignavibacteria bacterium]